MTCSQVGKVGALSAPYSEGAIVSLKVMGLVTNIGEDLPQIFIQVIFLVITVGDGLPMPKFVVFSLASSVLMLLSNALRRCLVLSNDRKAVKRKSQPRQIELMINAHTTANDKGDKNDGDGDDDDDSDTDGGDDSDDSENSHDQGGESTLEEVQAVIAKLPQGSDKTRLLSCLRDLVASNADAPPSSPSTP